MEVKKIVVNGKTVTCERRCREKKLDTHASCHPRTCGDPGKTFISNYKEQNESLDPGSASGMTVAPYHVHDARSVAGLNFRIVVPAESISNETFIITVTIDGTSHTASAQLISYDQAKKEACFLIDNRVVNVTGIAGSLSDKLQFFIKHQRITSTLPHTTVRIEQPQCHVPQMTSPLAGRVISILVRPGDTVAAGQPLIVIESMKMENELCAPSNAFIKTISIAPGNLVQTNQVLIIFEMKGELDATTKNRHGQATISDW